MLYVRILYPNQTPLCSTPDHVIAPPSAACCFDVASKRLRSFHNLSGFNFERRNRVSPHAWRLLIIHLSLISPSSSGSATSTSCFLKSAFMRLFKVPPPPPSARPLLSLLELELLERPPRLEAEVAPLLLLDA